MKGARILIVNLGLGHPPDPLVSLGAAGLFASVRASCSEPSALLSIDVAGRRAGPAQVCHEILRRVGVGDSAAVVGLGAYVWNDELVRATVRALRSAGFLGRIVIGGPQVTYGTTPDRDYPGADVFVRGYAEQALPAICSGDGSGLAGVQLARQPESSGLCRFDLAACPSPYLTGVLPVRPGQQVVRWETQRGCFYRCAYCQHRDPGSRPDVQVVPFERLDAEMDLFTARHVGEVKVLDPVFNSSGHAVRVLDGYRRRGFRGRLTVECRPELVNPEFVEGCAGLQVVPELGLQTIHAAEGRLVDRPVRLERIERAFGLLGQAGLRYVVTIIYGLPGQTIESFRATVDFCLRLSVPDVRAFPLMLLKGSGLDVRKRELGLETAPGRMPTVVRSPTFDERDLAVMARLAHALKAYGGRYPRSVAELEALARTEA